MRVNLQTAAAISRSSEVKHLDQLCNSSNITYQCVNGAQPTEVLKEVVGIVQVHCHTFNSVVLGAFWQLPCLALVKQLLKVHDAPLVLALNDSNPEHAGRLVSDLETVA